ncbi:MAG: hypothetical protein U9N62_03670, partial [Thermotogota bacterium]|nr:hypothetical protein [Thermotogota bacterium]
MSLFEIADIYFSHPDEYPLSTHIKNIAASFNDPTHKRAAAFHDLGKLNDIFQKNINNGGALPFHALEGAFFFLLYHNTPISTAGLTVIYQAVQMILNGLFPSHGTCISLLSFSTPSRIG